MARRLRAEEVLEAMSDVESDCESMYNESDSEGSDSDDIDASASDSDASSECSSSHDPLDDPDSQLRR